VPIIFSRYAFQSTPQGPQLSTSAPRFAVAATPLPATITETYTAKLENAQNMGYARSKLVVESMVKAAVENNGMNARVFRVGQIVGDSQNGIWNSTEAIPLMFRSATTLGALPELDEVS
jgi:thioester reductase-like protein